MGEGSLGKIITDETVCKIDVESRVVKGVELNSGEYFSAPTVIGAIHPQRVLAMLPEGAVKPSYRNRITKLKNTHSVFSVHASIDAKVHPELPYTLLPHAFLSCQ